MVPEAAHIVTQHLGEKSRLDNFDKAAQIIGFNTVNGRIALYYRRLAFFISSFQARTKKTALNILCVTHNVVPGFIVQSQPLCAGAWPILPLAISGDSAPAG